MNVLQPQLGCAFLAAGHVMVQEHRQIVLVDPDEDFSFLFAVWLSQVHIDPFFLHWLPNFAACLAYLKNHQPDLLILDYIINGGNGLQLLKTLYTCMPHPPTLLYTAWDKEEFESDPVFESLVDGYLSKRTCTTEEFQEIIFRLLKK